MITASEPLRERYRRSTGSFGNRSPASNSTPARSPNVRPTRPSNNKGKQRSTEPAANPQPPAVVSVKKKKKSKKVVKHEEPDPAKLELGKGPPAETAQTHEYDGGVSPINEEAGQWVGTRNQSEQRDGHISGYQVPDNEDFRNVWGRDEEAG